MWAASAAEPKTTRCRIQSTLSRSLKEKFHFLYHNHMLSVYVPVCLLKVPKCFDNSLNRRVRTQLYCPVDLFIMNSVASWNDQIQVISVCQLHMEMFAEGGRVIVLH